MSNTPYEYDENAPELQAVKSEEQAALEKSDKLFDDQISANNKKEEGILEQIDTNTQQLKDAQQEQTNLTIKEIEQNKADAKADYIKEQSGAWTDLQKQSNAYGVKAEQMAASGMQNTGYSESSQVAMYNAYQNRVAVARESYNRTVVSYNQSIAQAKAQNSVALAEIANKALAQSLEVSMQFATMNNSLFTQKVSNQNQIKSTYMQKWAAVLDELYKEAALAEQARQHNETLAEQKRQHETSLALEREKFNWQKAQASSAGGSGSIKKSSVGSSSSGGAKVEKPKDQLSQRMEQMDGKADYPVDTDSLVECGLANENAETIEKEIKAGRLLERVVNGKLTYERQWAGGPGIFSSSARSSAK